MADTSRYPVVTRTLIIFMALFHLTLIVVHFFTSGATGSRRIDNSIDFVHWYCLLMAISYFITFREIEYRYDDPTEGEYNGQWMQDLRTARTVIQLFTQSILLGIISLITCARIGTFGLAKRSRMIAKWFEVLIIAAIFVCGLTRVALTSWSYHTFYSGGMSWEQYQHMLAIAKRIDFGWVLSTGVFTFNLILRTGIHLLNVRTMGADDPVSRRLLFLVSPFLFLYTATIALTHLVLPTYLGVTIGEITGSPLALPALNDPTLTYSNLEYLEIIDQLAVAAELFAIVVILVWLLSNSARRYWVVGILDGA